MKIKLLLGTLFFWGTSIYAQDFSQVFQFEGTTNVGTGHIVIDEDQNIFIAGRYFDTLDLDPGPNTALVISEGISDIFLVKLDPDGNYLWGKTYGGPKADQVTELVALPGGSVILAGTFNDVAKFGFFTRTSIGQSDAFMMEVRGNGSVWNLATITGSRNQSISQIEIRPNDRSYWVRGNYSGTCDFDDSPVNDLLLSTGTSSGTAFIGHFSSNFTPLWVGSFDAISQGGNGNIAVDEQDNVYVTVSFQNTIDADPTASGVNTYTSAGNRDMILTKLTADHNYVWTKSWTTPVSIFTTEITFFKNRLYYYGRFGGKVDFDPSPADSLIIEGDTWEVFYMCTDTAGQIEWVKPILHNQDIDPSLLYISDNGLLYSTGQFRGTVDMDPDTSSTFPLSAFGQSGYINIMELDGSHINALAFIDSFSSGIYGVSVDANNQLFASGWFASTLDVDPGTGVTHIVNQGSVSNGFLLQFDQCAPSVPVVKDGFAVCAGDTVICTIDLGQLNTASDWYWYKDTCGGSLVGVGDTVVLFPDTTTTYYVKGEQGCRTGVCGSFTIDVFSQGFQFDLGEDTTLCNDQSLDLAVPGIYQSITWQDGTSDSIFLVDASQYTPGIYHFVATVQSMDGCITSDTISITITTCTSIENGVVSSLDIYPNPATNSIRLNWDGASTEEADVQIFNQQGKVVTRMVVSDVDGLLLDISDLRSGMYYLQIMTPKKRISRPLIIMR